MSLRLGRYLILVTVATTLALVVLVMWSTGIMATIRSNLLSQGIRGDRNAFTYVALGSSFTFISVLLILMAIKGRSIGNKLEEEAGSPKDSTMPVSSSRSSEVKREVRSTFDFISCDYDKLRSRIWEDLTQFTTESLFVPQPSKDRVILDLACGNARHAIHFAVKYEFRGIAIDFSIGLLNLARNRIGSSKLRNSVELVNADASNIPIRGQAINDVVYIAAIHHLPSLTERIKSMQEVSRVLTNDGRAVVTVWRKWQRRFASYFIKKHLRHPFGGGTDGELGNIYVPWRSGHGATSVSRYYHLFSKKELKRLLSEAGFKIVRIVKSSKRAGEGSFFACIEKHYSAWRDV